MVTTTKPSSWSLTAHLVVAIRAAAFVMPYAAMSPSPNVLTNFESPAAEPITTIFLVLPARRSVRKAEMPWMTPSALTLYCGRQTRSMLVWRPQSHVASARP